MVCYINCCCVRNFDVSVLNIASLLGGKVFDALNGSIMDHMTIIL